MKYEALKHTRLKRYFRGVTTFEKGLWWDIKNKRWVENPNFDGDWSSHAPCKTVRAFRRMLRKHPIIKGKAVLCNKFIGYNVYG